MYESIIKSNGDNIIIENADAMGNVQGEYTFENSDIFKMDANELIGIMVSMLNNPDWLTVALYPTVNDVVKYVCFKAIKMVSATNLTITNNDIKKEYHFLRNII